MTGSPASIRSIPGSDGLDQQCPATPMPFVLSGLDIRRQPPDAKHRRKLLGKALPRRTGINDHMSMVKKASVRKWLNW
jgi:hypothetical protein